MNTTSLSSVLMVSDLTTGGAAIACRRLHTGLVRRGVDAKWVALRGESGADVVSAMDWPDLLSMVYQRFDSRLFRNPSFGSRLAELHAERSGLNVVRRHKAKVINLHNIHDAASFRFVEHLPRKVPIVWTLHDMWALTGHCYYSCEGDSYCTGCRPVCPLAVRRGTSNSDVQKEWQRRDRFFKDNASRMVLVSPSQWLADCARRRFGKQVRVVHIPNALATDIFRPLADKQSLRLALGLPLDRPILLAGYQSIKEERKGAKWLMEALGMLTGKTGSPVVVFFGTEGDRHQFPENWIFQELVHDERLMNLYYNAADAYVLPSLADNLPNTLLESLSAGTPCIAFGAGGIPEVIHEGKTGFLVPPRDAAALASAIDRVCRMDPEEQRALSACCRMTAEREYALAVQAERYSRLFDEYLAPS